MSPSPPEEQKRQLRSDFPKLITESSVDRITNDRVLKTFEEYYSPTLSVSFTYIEGYLMKAIEKTRMIRLDKWHLRFFRVMFQGGRLAIKEDKKGNKMKTYPLSGLRNVILVDHFDGAGNVYGNNNHTYDHQKKYSLSAEQIRDMFNINERSE